MTLLFILVHGDNVEVNALICVKHVCRRRTSRHGAGVPVKDSEFTISHVGMEAAEKNWSVSLQGSHMYSLH